MSANPVATALRCEFPKLWELSEQYDFAERLGGSTDPLLAEADAALRELWMARSALAEIESKPYRAEEVSARQRLDREHGAGDAR